MSVIQQIRECRVVVTGSYHGAVFALAQGIPAVVLASSVYYRNKMSGLADQFGEGCHVVAFEPLAELGSRISAAIDWAWREADRLRPALLSRSADQVARGHAAYARLRSLVANRTR
jgi:colanic acid/amylovoran biosynthesis protein